jgi:hypothetical protein
MLGQGSSASSSELVPSQALRTRLQVGIGHPKVYNDGTVRYGNLVISELPKNLFTALANPNWKAAMDSKFSSLV